jgi:hypothetical protein
MHIIMPSFRGLAGGGLIYSITRGIVVLILLRIGAVLLLQNASFRTFCLFPSNSVVFFFGGGGNDCICCRL